MGKFGPSVATSATGTPVLCDMKPSTENMTKPPKKLVAQLMAETRTESLQRIANTVDAHTYIEEIRQEERTEYLDTVRR